MPGPLNVKLETTHLYYHEYCLWRHVTVQLYPVIGPQITGYNACILHPAPDDAPPGQNMKKDNCAYMCSQFLHKCCVMCWSLM